MRVFCVVTPEVISFVVVTIQASLECMHQCFQQAFETMPPKGSVRAVRGGGKAGGGKDKTNKLAR